MKFRQSREALRASYGGALRTVLSLCRKGAASGVAADPVTPIPPCGSQEWRGGEKNTDIRNCKVTEKSREIGPHFPSRLSLRS